jgi:hypothetical protein
VNVEQSVYKLLVYKLDNQGLVTSMRCVLLLIIWYTHAVTYIHHMALQAPTSFSEEAKALDCGTDHRLPSSAEDENTLYLLTSMHLYVSLCL